MAGNEKLTRREREIMDAIFALGKGTVTDVRANIKDPLSYSAARAVLTRLVNKGELKYREDGPRYVYTPARALSSARKSAMQKLKDTFFGGSSLQTMTAFLGETAAELSADELDKLEALIAAAKTKKRQEDNHGK